MKFRMSYVEQIKEIWNSEEMGSPRDIGVIIKELVVLLEKARDAHENIPIELETELLVNANLAYGYGNDPEDAYRIINLLFRLLKTKSNISSIKPHTLFRLISLAQSAVLTALVIDDQNNTRTTQNIMRDFGVSLTTSKSNILLTLFKEIVPVISELYPKYTSSVSLETLSFIITLVGIIKEMNAWDEQSEKILKNLVINKNDENLIKTWKSNWIETTDYFRFTYLMITGKNADENLWINIAKQFI